MGHRAYGRQRGRGRGLGLATAWARGVFFSPAGPCWSGLHSMGTLSFLALTPRTNFFGSRSRGVVRRVRGVAGGTEVRAGWGRGSERVRAPQTWSLGNVT